MGNSKGKECRGSLCEYFSVEPDEKPDGTILGYPECSKDNEIEEWGGGEECEEYKPKPAVPKKDGE